VAESGGARPPTSGFPPAAPTAADEDRATTHFLSTHFSKHVDTILHAGSGVASSSEPGARSGLGAGAGALAYLLKSSTR
jgi:hypothetical protein